MSISYDAACHKCKQYVTLGCTRGSGGYFEKGPTLEWIEKHVYACGPVSIHFEQDSALDDFQWIEDPKDNTGWSDEKGDYAQFPMPKEF